MKSILAQKPLRFDINPFAPGFFQRLHSPIRKIAVFRASRIGDYICAMPALRSLRNGFPNAEISLIALHLVEPLARRTKYIDAFYEFPGFPGIAEQLYSPDRANSFLSEMQKKNFDVMIQMHGSGVFSNPLAIQMGAQYTVGFVRNGDSAGKLDAAFQYDPLKHEVRRLLSFLSFLGIAAVNSHLEFPLTDEDRNVAIQLLKDAVPPLIAVHPFAREVTKQWPRQRFVKAAVDLQKEYRGTIVLLGEGGGFDFEEQPSGPMLDLTGRTSLPVLGGVIERLNVLLTNDSGPAHIAYALKVPSVTVFGSTLSQNWGPRSAARHRIIEKNIPCRPCDYAECPIGYCCLSAISVEEVVHAAKTVIR